MSFHVCSLFALYVFVSRLALVDAAPFSHFFARDAGDSSSTNFRLQNGIKAQQLNAQFATLTASDSCTAGNIACVNGAFAQCVGGKWALTQCSGGLSCFALPLVNSNGTSIACDTEQDAISRISTSGASGGLTGAGNGNNSISSGSSTTSSNTTVVSASTNGVNAPTSIINSATSTPTGNPNDLGGSTGNSTNSTAPPTSITGSPTNVAGTATPSSSSNANSTAGGHTAGDDSGDGDDCNDNIADSSSSKGNSTATKSSDEGGDDCDGDDSMGNSGNSTNSTTNNNTDTSGTNGVTSSSAPASAPTTSASQVSPNGNSQLYRRQFITDTGAATFPVPTQTAQTPSFSFSSGQAGTDLPSFTPTASFQNAPSNSAASTVTFILVSTVTMTVSGCQGNPTNFPPLASGTPEFSTAPNTTPTGPFTFGTPASSTPTASIPLSDTFATPTSLSSSSSSGVSLGNSGISFSSQGGNNVDLEPTPTSAFPTTMPQYPTNGPASSFNLSELLTATAN